MCITCKYAQTEGFQLFEVFAKEQAEKLSMYEERVTVAWTPRHSSQSIRFVNGRVLRVPAAALHAGQTVIDSSEAESFDSCLPLTTFSLLTVLSALFRYLFWSLRAFL